jgi:hypothetical protein
MVKSTKKEFPNLTFKAVNFKEFSWKWKGFEQSTTKPKENSNRYIAKCSKCHLEFEGKTDYLTKHVGECKQWPAEEKKQYFAELLKSKCTLPSSSSADTESIPADDIKSYFKKMGKEEELQHHIRLCKAFVLSNIPFAFADSPQFKDFQRSLAKSPYCPPSRHKLSYEILPYLGAQIEMEILDDLKKQDYLTLSIDGWTDVSRTSIYACMALKSDHTKHYLGPLEFHQARHTAENIREALKSFLVNKLDLSKVAAIVTDSPTTMVKFRRELSQEFTNVVGLRYFDFDMLGI